MNALAVLLLPGVAWADPHPTLSDETVAALQDGDCALCHVVPQVQAATRLESCTDCHVWIAQVSANPASREKALAAFPLWERYERTVTTYMVVPDLQAAMARLEPSWVEAYLQDPHDLRPQLPETMPRFQLDTAQVKAIAAAFTPSPVPTTAPLEPDKVAAGAAIFSDKGCPSCHTFGALHTGPGLATAPDLAHTRDRMSPDRVAAWIHDPKALAPSATMPSFGLSESEVLAVRDYLLLADPGWSDAPALGPAPAPTTEPVSWAQVEERVFGRICAHCHMKPEQNQGRAGPGNAGGFGYPATGIELQTREGVMQVAELIPDALLRRRAEAHRDVVAPGQRPAELVRPDKPGMPLGLPPLPDEDIALVLGWLQQGMPE